MDDEVISNIIDITGTTPDIARQYAQLADNDVSQAIQLFFENGGADLSTGASAPPPPSRSFGTGASSNPINIDDDSPQPHPNASNDFEDDEAMARRLQEEMYGSRGQEQEVRAPIARQAETLVGPGADIMDDYEDAMQARLQAIRQRGTNSSSKYTCRS
jgi:UBX domain-containing protein 7